MNKFLLMFLCIFSVKNIVAAETVPCVIRCYSESKYVFPTNIGEIEGVADEKIVLSNFEDVKLKLFSFRKSGSVTLSKTEKKFNLLEEQDCKAQDPLYFSYTEYVMTPIKYGTRQFFDAFVNGTLRQFDPIKKITISYIREQSEYFNGLLHIKFDRQVVETWIRDFPQPIRDFVNSARENLAALARMMGCNEKVALARVMGYDEKIEQSKSEEKIPLAEDTELLEREEGVWSSESYVVVKRDSTYQLTKKESELEFKLDEDFNVELISGYKVSYRREDKEAICLSTTEFEADPIYFDEENQKVISSIGSEAFLYAFFKGCLKKFVQSRQAALDGGNITSLHIGSLSTPTFTKDEVEGWLAQMRVEFLERLAQIDHSGQIGRYRSFIDSKIIHSSDAAISAAVTGPASSRAVSSTAPPAPQARPPVPQAIPPAQQPQEPLVVDAAGTKPVISDATKSVVNHAVDASVVGVGAAVGVLGVCAVSGVLAAVTGGTATVSSGVATAFTVAGSAVGCATVGSGVVVIGIVGFAVGAGAYGIYNLWQSWRK